MIKIIITIVLCFMFFGNLYAAPECTTSYSALAGEYVTTCTERDSIIRQGESTTCRTDQFSGQTVCD